MQECTPEGYLWVLPYIKLRVTGLWRRGPGRGCPASGQPRCPRRLREWTEPRGGCAEALLAGLGQNPGFSSRGVNVPHVPPLCF